MRLVSVIPTAVNAVLPIVLLILLGYILRQKGFLNANFSKVGNSLVFYVCLPAMLFINVYSIEGLSAIRWDIVAYCVAITGVMFAIGFWIATAATDVPTRRGVILQCTFRSNFAIIGLPLAATLGGEGAAAIAAIISAFTIPLFSMLSVIALSVFLETSDSGKADIKKILANIYKNPLILGVSAGLAALVIRAAQMKFFGSVVFSLKEDATFLHTALNNLKSAASPLAIIVLGSQFEFSAAKGMLKEIAAGVTARIILTPAIGLGLAVLLNELTTWILFGPDEFPALIALFGSPVAVSSAVMARSMKNDEQLATQLVVWTSIGSMATIFLTVCVLMMFGYLAA